MALSKSPYRGTRDLFPQNKRKQQYIFDVMRKTAQAFCFEPYDGPLLEEVDLYRAKSGTELINEQIYAFIDRGEREVAIRPEMTPTLARMVAQIHREVAKPLRWYSIPNLMRYEKPQKGRLREHWQFNCDIFGAPENLGETEILQVAVSLFKNFGANQKHFEILLNDC
jgi:histidyl-tRNA synthetase